MMWHPSVGDLYSFMPADYHVGKPSVMLVTRIRTLQRTYQNRTLVEFVEYPTDGSMPTARWADAVFFSTPSLCLLGRSAAEQCVTDVIVSSDG